MMTTPFNLQESELNQLTTDLQWPDLTAMSTEGLESPLLMDDDEFANLFDDSVDVDSNDFDSNDFKSNDFESNAQDMFLTIGGDLEGIDAFDIASPLRERSSSFQTFEFSEEWKHTKAIVIQSAYRSYRERVAATVIQAAYRSYRERDSDDGATFIGDMMDSSSVDEETDSECESDENSDDTMIPLVETCNTCSTACDTNDNGNCHRCEKDIARRVEKENKRIERQERMASQRRQRIAASVEKRSRKRSRCSEEGIECHGCDRTFKTNQALKIHIMGHGTADKPGHGAMDALNHPLRWRYGEEFIPKDFDHLYNKCTLCNHGFLEGGINRKWLKRHYKRHHPEHCLPAPMAKNHCKKQKTDEAPRWISRDSMAI